MNVVDSSVIIAGFASWHESHERARAVLDDAPRLVAHCAVETYSVLTRLPPPHRAPAALVAEFLAQRFPASVLTLSATKYGQMMRLLPSLGIAGGATYDALVASTAAAHQATLLTLDKRAEETYRRVGVTYRYVR